MLSYQGSPYPLTRTWKNCKKETLKIRSDWKRLPNFLEKLLETWLTMVTLLSIHNQQLSLTGIKQAVIPLFKRTHLQLCHRFKSIKKVRRYLLLSQPIFPRSKFQNLTQRLEKIEINSQTNWTHRQLPISGTSPWYRLSNRTHSCCQTNGTKATLKLCGRKRSKGTTLGK